MTERIQNACTVARWMSCPAVHCQPGCSRSGWIYGGAYLRGRLEDHKPKRRGNPNGDAHVPGPPGGDRQLALAGDTADAVPADLRGPIRHGSKRTAGADGLAVARAGAGIRQRPDTRAGARAHPRLGALAAIPCKMARRALHVVSADRLPPRTRFPRAMAAMNAGARRRTVIRCRFDPATTTSRSPVERCAPPAGRIPGRMRRWNAMARLSPAMARRIAHPGDRVVAARDIVATGVRANAAP